MFLISQEVLAQQLFNNEVPLLNETKHYGFFFLLSVIMTNIIMKYLFCLHGRLSSKNRATYLSSPVLLIEPRGNILA